MNGQQVRDKLTESKDERGVSPVIGVILMVAITVILAAVIAAFVMGIGPGSEAVTASATISGSQTSTVDISVSDGGNADKLAIVDPSDGSIVGVSSNINTGATYTVDNGSGSFTMSGYSTGTEYDLYAVQGSVSAGDPLDAAEGSIELGSFTEST